MFLGLLQIRIKADCIEIVYLHTVLMSHMFWVPAYMSTCELIFSAED